MFPEVPQPCRRMVDRRSGRAREQAARPGHLDVNKSSASESALLRLRPGFTLSSRDTRVTRQPSKKLFPLPDGVDVRPRSQTMGERLIYAPRGQPAPRQRLHHRVAVATGHATPPRCIPAQQHSLGGVPRGASWTRTIKRVSRRRQDHGETPGKAGQGRGCAGGTASTTPRGATAAEPRQATPSHAVPGGRDAAMR